MDRIAILFPGQGSQEVGMGRSLFQAFPVARRTFEEADEILGFRLSAICFGGPDDVLNDTLYTQPAIFVTSIAILRVMESWAFLPAPALMAGHSLGELTALVAAGTAAFEDGLRLVQERGRLMKHAGEQSPGGMAAVIKMDAALVESACRQATEELGKPVGIANYNSPNQVVLSGDDEALVRAMELLRERGGRRIIRLAVSIAAHSPLMRGIVEEFRAAIDAAPLQTPGVPVVSNITARPLSSVPGIREELAGQLTQPVRWTETIQWMAGQGTTLFIEVGPGQVLSRLVGQIEPAARASNASDAASLEALAETWERNQKG